MVHTMLPCMRLLFCYCLLGYAAAAPLRHRPDLDFFSEDQIEYLTQFGYLPESDRETGNLRTDDQLKNAIGDLQEFAGLERTGRIDGPTRELMTKPRCGVPDPQGVRRRRYAVHGQTWDHTNLTWSLRTWLTNGLDHHKTRYDLGQALAVWSNHSKLTFREVYGDQADILIYFENVTCDVMVTKANYYKVGLGFVAL